MCNSGICGFVGAPVPGKFEYSAFSAELDLTSCRPIEQIVAMQPEEMAKSSRIVMGAYNELLQVAGSLENQQYRELMTECIVGPKVAFLEMYPSSEDRQRLFSEMVRLGFFNEADGPEHVFPDGNMAPQTYLTAPSSHNDFYNAHPGGLAVTVAYNIRMAEAYANNYRQLYGIPVNRDLPVAALCVHEYPKTWLYQWQRDGSWLEEPRTVYDDTWHAHCIFATAELMYRRYDARIVMAMAAAHQLSMLDAGMDGRDVVCDWVGYKRVAHFIQAAAVMAQIDPVDYGLLEKKGNELVLAPQPAEQWVTHLSDMNWPYTMGAAHLYTEPLLKSYAERVLGIPVAGREFNQLKNYVWSQIGQIPLYEIFVREGRDEVFDTLRRLVSKN